MLALFYFEAYFELLSLKDYGIEKLYLNPGQFGIEFNEAEKKAKEEAEKKAKEEAKKKAKEEAEKKAKEEAKEEA